MIRAFLLDDHEVVRRGLTELLHAAGDIEVVGESGSAQEATGESLLCVRTSLCSTRACPTATASMCAATCARSTPRSGRTLVPSGRAV
jgi:hypothetical protein